MSEQEANAETTDSAPPTNDEVTATESTESTGTDTATDGEATEKPKPKKKARKKAAKKTATTRTRTRTRTTTKTDDAPDAESATAESADAKVTTRTSSAKSTAKADDHDAASASNDDQDASGGDRDEQDDEDGGAGRRRRRGSRGGRGTGSKKVEQHDDDEVDGAGADTSRTDAAKDEQSKDEADEKPSSGRTRKKAASRSTSSGGRSSAKTSAAKDEATGEDGSADESAEVVDDGKSKADRETEKAIAKGGTRMAAKRRGRSGSGGGGGSRGGGRDKRGQGPRGVSEETRRAILDGPPRTMLVTHTEDRTQIVVMEDRRAVEHYVTHAGDVTYVGNIYMARVQNVLPGMEAAFLDIGKGRNGVLYAGEVLYDEQDLEGDVPRIENILKPGQKVLVQVTKDPMGTKGPRLTQHLSLAGRYCVLAPNSDLFGISRKLTDKERDRLRKVVKKVKPEQHGIIVRTAAENATDEALTADLERLLAKWEKVEEAAKDAKPMSTVYEEPKLVVKVIRDNFGPEFEKCIVDDKVLFEEVKDYLDQVASELVDKLELYEPKTDGEHEKPESLLSAYNVAEQLRKATDRKVWLPSGGYLIIETTEAMKVVDVNTGKFTGSKDTSLEEVVLKTNLEAADEIVRQMRLRDMGGIIIIDFIDMLLKANQDQVIRRLKRELLRDRTKTRVSEVSRLGLVQMTRKNVSQGLVESFSTKCEHCNGLGRIVELPD